MATAYRQHKPDAFNQAVASYVAWWSAKEVNQRKADRLPHEAGLKLLSTPRAERIASNGVHSELARRGGLEAVRRGRGKALTR